MGIGTLELGVMAMGLFGGLAIFLFGMELMTDALKAVAGDGMRKLLERLTTNRFKAVLAGGVTTAIIQSSSVTTVLTVGFVGAGLMSLQQSIGIIMGAEIGTTVTAQIIAFKITKYALALVAVGFALKFFFQSERVRLYGSMILGFGLLFFGMTIMKTAMGPLKDHEPFLNLMKDMDNPILAILVSALFTGLVQSSSATTGVVIVLGSEGLISLEAAIALVLGANIGTCVTALLASIGKPRVAVQTALIHVTFNTLGVLMWFAFIPRLAEFVRTFSSDPARQIANAHTTFNVTNTLVFIGFTGALARFVQWVLPPRMEVTPGRIQPRYLDENLLPTASLALDRAYLELERMGKRVVHMVRHAPAAVMTGSPVEVQAVAKMDDDVDALHEAIVDYLAQISRQPLTEEQTGALQDALAISNYMENMADVIETNLVAVGLDRATQGLDISESTRAVLGALIDEVELAVLRSFAAVEEESLDLAQAVIGAKPEITHLADEAHRHLRERLGADEPQRLAAYRVEAELVESFKRIYYLAKRIAKVVIEAEAPTAHAAAG